jgi:CheY-like chemotaxis protein
VLVVDDERDNRLLLSAILARAGAVVETADCASLALEKMSTFRPQLLVSDIGLPGEDGHALMRRIRALDADHGGLVPAIASSGFGSSAERKRALDAGFDLVLDKPVQVVELVRAAERLAQPVEVANDGSARRARRSS